LIVVLLLAEAAELLVKVFADVHVVEHAVKLVGEFVAACLLFERVTDKNGVFYYGSIYYKKIITLSRFIIFSSAYIEKESELMRRFPSIFQ